ncbi:hypothetical protein FB593_11224 [Rhizobium sp. SJZ105]|nr:hypothetical protein FB593_11224 [Rhizobium sp. SJZ105]
MADREPKTPVVKNTAEDKRDEASLVDKDADNSSQPAPVDRPGFDLGGSTGKTSAGTGVGLGPDAAENRQDRSLPGRRGKRE